MDVRLKCPKLLLPGFWIFVKILIYRGGEGKLSLSFLVTVSVLFELIRPQILLSSEVNN